LPARATLPPGPTYPPLIQFVGIWTRPLAFLERCRARYGPRFTIRLPLTPPFVMLTDPDEIKEVFTAPPDVLAPGRGARVLEPVVGSTSVILLDGQRHMEQRRLMLPAFHGERIARLKGLVSAVTDRAIAGWPTDRPVDLHPELQRLTLEIILRAVFGLDPGPRLDALREQLQAMLAFGDRPISLMPPPLDSRAAAVLQHVGPFADFWRLRLQADELIFAQIAERRRQQEEHPDQHERRDDVLAMLLDARHEDGSPMTPDELRDELLTLLVAGHETTASSLAWAFQCLSHDHRALTSLRAELDSGDENDRYLTATIHETLRHRPVLPNVAPRFVQQPIEIGGVMYPPGVALVANAYLVHHDRTIYPDPYKFRPERFRDNSPGTYTWIPFGGGRRRCLGASFALLEMKIVLRNVLRSRGVNRVGDRMELPRRRNITIRPGFGGKAWLPNRDHNGHRAPARTPALAGTIASEGI
jgi:cytochrome P450